jgi:phosphoglycolate phosphatase-like HAD superfamily hydrolase
MRRYAILFWDFDGVIKESVAAKTETFARLFRPFGDDVAEQVCAHHERHGGMSRFEKIPIYLQWAGIVPSASEVERYCQAFSIAVRQSVIQSQWVPGAREYLQANRQRQRFVLVSATPQAEIEAILSTLEMLDWFSDVFGAPATKSVVLSTVLSQHGCRPESALLIGDSEADYVSALAVGVDFLLRQTALNQSLQATYTGPRCENFLHG